MIPEIPLAQSIIQAALAQGLTQVVICPGSRNAPLTIGFASNKFFTCYSIADERSAAFFALGMAQQIKSPVILLCTSGSAVLNFYPAVAEAFYSMIPLVVISADRPPDKIDIGDGQTIRQENVLVNHTIFNANLTPDASSENTKLVVKAMNLSAIQKAPVHINAPFEEPLYNTVKEWIVEETVPQLPVESNQVDTFDIANFLPIWNNSFKKLILVGCNLPNQINPATLQFLADDATVVVMTETTSNLHHKSFLPHIDRIVSPLNEQEADLLQPDLLITFGGMVISKKIKSFLRTHKPKHHWHIDPLRAYDTFGVLSKHVKTQPEYFFNVLFSHGSKLNSDYASKLHEIAVRRSKKHAAFSKKAVFSDWQVFNTIIAAIPKNYHIQVANSAPIRYLQLFDCNSSWSCFCNRGTSGIEGSTSTAIGAALWTDQPTLLITGDISFFYDSNALWNNYIPKGFKIIIVNNGGGGIFRILPGHQDTALFHTFFETAHNLNASHLADMHGFSYYSANHQQELDLQLPAFFTTAESAILEIFTPTHENNRVLDAYFKSLAEY